MREVKYKTFSRKAHMKNSGLKNPNVCQFELTFGCGLHCKHCYTDCYNKPVYLKKELNTRQVKLILNKAHNAGIIWLCFTGGDPLTRSDFLDIYSYAKDKGFIITIFTNAYSMTQEIVDYLKKQLPFVIEITLNAVSKDLYEKISQTKGSFDRVMKGIDLILKAKLPLKIKTQITRDNLKEIPEIKKFVQGLGLRFRPSYDLYARLNGNLTPYNLRINAQDILHLNGNKRIQEDCELLPNTENRTPRTEHREPRTRLFRCAIGGGDGIHVDPYGNTFPCNLIRKPSFNLLEFDINYAVNKLLPLVKNSIFSTDSKCNGCNLRENCHWCPGRAYVERGDLEKPIEYYCKLAEELSSRESFYGAH
jgi:radical SAM protein with 4Fe4S-binding SPASM domain